MTGRNSARWLKTGQEVEEKDAEPVAREPHRSLS